MRFVISGRHDHDVTAWSEITMQLQMLWHFLLEQPKQPYIKQATNHFLAHLQADIDTVSFVTSYNHVIDVMASRYDMTT